MKKHLNLCLSVLTVFLAAGCTGMTQVAKEIADKAPAARTPEVYATRKLHTWPNDNNYYSDGFSFNLYVKRGFANKFTILENGLQVPPFNGEDPGNAAQTVMKSTDLKHDTNALWTQTEYQIFPKIVQGPNGKAIPPADGTVTTYTLIEESINPKYKGTADQTSSKEVKVVVVNKPCTIALFTVPRSVNIGQSAEIKYRVNDCKEVKLFENDAVIDTKTANGAAENLEGTKSIVVAANTDFKIRATNARGKSLEVKASLQVTTPPPCPGNSNGGYPLYYTFCATCRSDISGDYKYEQTVLACNQTSAEQWVKNNFVGCAVAAGYCQR
jgi:hypothetical protein